MARDEAKTDLVDGPAGGYLRRPGRAGPATVTAEQAEEVFATKLARTGRRSTRWRRIDAEGLDAMIVVGDDQAEHLGPENLSPCSSTTAPRCATLAESALARRISPS
jgi:hypothetical protein